MTYVYILLTLCSNFTGNNEITNVLDTKAYKTADSCLAAQDKRSEKLRKECKQQFVECSKQKIN